MLSMDDDINTDTAITELPCTRSVSGAASGPWLVNGADDASLCLALAHGAGAPMDSPFMEWFASQLAGPELRVVRFEFPYMRRRRESGGRTAPDAMGTLRRTWLEIIEALGADRLAIGGKSMGGRVASMVADDAGVRGLVCLGYPFHPAGKPEKTRVEHLQHLATPALICQGERDSLGAAAEVQSYALSPRISLAWLADGDHGFKPRKRSGLTEEQNWLQARDAIRRFLGTL
jgi:predicted alpha/beta-hydrolase family hydrolase